jgi:hypothetical protein
MEPEVEELRQYLQHRGHYHEVTLTKTASRRCCGSSPGTSLSGCTGADLGSAYMASLREVGKPESGARQFSTGVNSMLVHLAVLTGGHQLGQPLALVRRLIEMEDSTLVACSSSHSWTGGKWDWQSASGSWAEHQAPGARVAVWLHHDIAEVAGTGSSPRRGRRGLRSRSKPLTSGRRGPASARSPRRWASA